ncbi:MAG: type IV pilus twitching motility protein PilT [Deltaproteobacteria bacterium]|nr:type IV pilus twitching motility protein PilT [Deltaproteobacteria bacterium]
MDKETFHKILTAATRAEASDIHLKVSTSILLRVNGVLQEAKSPALTPQDTRAVAEIMLEGTHEPPPVDAIREWDGSYSLAGVGRFRVNIYRQRNTFAVILRAIPFEVPSLDGLGLPPVLKEIAVEERGLVLVTGVTGSGKTSTLAAIVDYINERQRCHILTIEDPIEFIHKNKRSSISQRELGLDTANYSVALRAALRQDPDIILVGEMRDTETIDIALKAAETGHLVFSTVHTTDAAKTVGRLISVFPPQEQNMVRIRLAENLKATVSQRLLPKKGDRGRVAAVEVLRMTKTIEECIKDPLRTHEVKDVIEEGRDAYGTQSFDQHLMDLFNRGVIDFETARSAATNPSDFERAVLLNTGGAIPE